MVLQGMRGWAVHAVAALSFLASACAAPPPPAESSTLDRASRGSYSLNMPDARVQFKVKDSPKSDESAFSDPHAVGEMCLPGGRLVVTDKQEWWLTLDDGSCVLVSSTDDFSKYAAQMIHGLGPLRENFLGYLAFSLESRSAPFCCPLANLPDAMLAAHARESVSFVDLGDWLLKERCLIPGAWRDGRRFIAEVQLTESGREKVRRALGR